MGRLHPVVFAVTKVRAAAYRALQSVGVPVRTVESDLELVAGYAGPHLPLRPRHKAASQVATPVDPTTKQSKKKR